MNAKATLQFFGLLFVIILVTLGVVKIWFPDAISDDSFVKTVVTFGLLTVGALAMSFLGRGKSSSDDDKKAD